MKFFSFQRNCVVMNFFNELGTFYFLCIFVTSSFISETSKTKTRCNKYNAHACKSSFTGANRIIGGRDAKGKEYPHMVLIGRGKTFMQEYFCGGSLISENFVLTAAHCVTKPLNMMVRLGELNLASNKVDATPVDYKVTEIFLHPDYNPTVLLNDIALLKFQGVSVITDYIRPICLDTGLELATQKVVAIGWGRVKPNKGENDPALQTVEIYLESTAKCREIRSNHNASTMICAGFREGGKGVCFGDSGGPLQILTESAECPGVPIYTQIGVVSGGNLKGECGSKDNPAWFTKVSHFIPWIESIVGN